MKARAARDGELALDEVRGVSYCVITRSAIALLGSEKARR
jgi:hypothetical protein